MAARQRIRAVISGRVQGVCFRAETRAEALRLGLSGWVRNRSDGTVETEFEGEAEAVRALLAWLRHGPPLAFVGQIDTTDRPLLAGETSFRIVS